MHKGKNKAKRTVISLETKTTILRRIAEGEGSTALGKEFGLGESTIRGIQKRAGEINESSNYATNESAKRASYSRNILLVKTEKALILWIEELIQKRVPLDGELIKEKAMWFYNQLKDLEPSCSSSHIGRQTFSASNGWLAGFSQRHALRNLKIKGDTASAAETAANNYSEVPAKSIQDGGYCSIQVFNNDAKGFFPKTMPSRTLIAKSEKTTNGFTTGNDRVNFSNCSNASGARVLKPFTNCVGDADGHEEPDYMTADKIYAGLQLCHKLECHFLAIDTNSERTSKFQRQLQSCTSGYRDIYKRLIRQQSSQKLITDYYMVAKKKSNLTECEVVSVSDESDFETVCHKEVHVLSDYED